MAKLAFKIGSVGVNTVVQQINNLLREKPRAEKEPAAAAPVMEKTETVMVPATTTEFHMEGIEFSIEYEPGELPEIYTIVQPGLSALWTQALTGLKEVALAKIGNEFELDKGRNDLRFIEAKTDAARVANETARLEAEAERRQH